MIIAKYIQAFMIISRSFLLRIINVTDKSYRGNQNTIKKYEGWNFNSGNYLFTTDTK